jgi:23S rRNA (cytosine1962-C5)-methyltransferase
MSLGRVVLKPRRARPFFARHPWVFDSSIERVAGDPAPGDEVAVVTSEGQFIARGLYNPASTIRVRLYRWDDGPLDAAFWSASLAGAVRLRHEVLGLRGENLAYRLIFSEGDGLSGLTVDVYARWLVAQFTSLALYGRRALLLPLLVESTGCVGVVARTDRGVAPKEGLRTGEEETLGAVPDDSVAIVEHGLTYEVGLRVGQKTGFYLDQRENRRAVAGFCRGKRVLDLCCFTGGFALNAVKHGAAASALGVDSSASAVELARRHAAINGIELAQFEAGDVLEVLDRLRRQGRRFEVVICDPPKYARQAKDVENALKGYLRLNLAALDVLEVDGILVTCSCSGLISRELFVQLIGTLAERSGRPIQILEQRGQATDHPIAASCLETEYLKCLICAVGGRRPAQALSPSGVTE